MQGEQLILATRQVDGSWATETVTAGEDRFATSAWTVSFVESDSQVLARSDTGEHKIWKHDEATGEFVATALSDEEVTTLRGNVGWWEIQAGNVSSIAAKSVTLSPDEQRAAWIGASRRSIDVSMKRADGVIETIHLVGAPSTQFTAISWLGDGSALIAGAAEGEIHIWNTSWLLAADGFIEHGRSLPQTICEDVLARVAYEDVGSEPGVNLRVFPNRLITANDVEAVPQLGDRLGEDVCLPHLRRPTLVSQALDLLGFGQPAGK